MLELPHDKLYKLFAVGGLVVAALAGMAAAERYDQAEIRRIEAESKTRAAQMAYDKYKEVAERQIEVARSIQESSDYGSKRAVLAEFSKLGEEADKRGETLDAAVRELRTHGDLNKHYAFMQKLWLVVGASVAAIALLASAWGFVSWHKKDSATSRSA